MTRKIFLILIAVKTVVILLVFSVGMVDLPAALAQDPLEEKATRKFAKDTEGVTQRSIQTEMIESLKTREDELKKKEEELSRREDQLKSVEQDIEKKIKELERVQVKLEDLVKMRKDIEDKNITSLSKTYAFMSPADAAKRIKAMNRAIALKLLSQMKSKKSAQILSNLDAKTATEMTEQLAKRTLE